MTLETPSIAGGHFFFDKLEDLRYVI
ncbi:Protein of unknown function [Thermobacillus xylanilyticus]|uniref:Uncharacterized protein n=1 Tax=Thermobacillus xylanilyticus TaxID=76633 RepID=A0ABN7RP39_THEXY|nr:Protein of unknown function [Thermobacillus xylanilyticus]